MFDRNTTEITFIAPGLVESDMEETQTISPGHSDREIRYNNKMTFIPLNDSSGKA